MKDIKEQCEEKNLDLLSFYCSRLINVISMQIRDIRNVQMGHNRLLQKFEKDGKCSELTRSYVKSQIYNCKEVMKRYLNLNRDLCCHLSKMNDTEDIYCDIGNVNLLEKSNINILFPPNQICTNYDLCENTNWIKQRSKMWYDMQKKAKVTGSTCFKAIGLGLLREAQEHYDEYILHKPTKKPSPQLQEMFEHGSANEIHGISTVTNILLPSLLPNCMVYVEDGCQFLHGNVQENLLEVSSDGIIMCKHEINCRDCNSNCTGGHYKRIVEVK